MNDGNCDDTLKRPETQECQLGHELIIDNDGLRKAVNTIVPVIDYATPNANLRPGFSSESTTATSGE